MEQLLTQLDSYLAQALLILAGLSALTALLRKIAKLTETTKDDEALTFVDSLIARAYKLIDLIKPSKKQ